MARLNTIAIGPGRGSAGDATYRQSRGRTIMSAKIKENPSNTPLQEKQRRTFGGTSTVFANQPWFVANFSKSKYGSEVNHLMHVNRAKLSSPDWADFVRDYDHDKYFLEYLTEHTWNYGVGFYFAHGDAEYFNTSTRLQAGTNVIMQNIIISANEALQKGASLAIRGKVKLGDADEKDVNVVFRLQQVDSDIWDWPGGLVDEILEQDKLPFYIDGAGLAHVVMPFLGWSTSSFTGWTAQWKELAAIGIPNLHGTTTLPAAFWERYGPASDQKIDWGVLMLHINGKPVTYYKPGDVINIQEAPAVAAAPAKATKKKAKKAECEEAEK